MPTDLSLVTEFKRRQHEDAQEDLRESLLRTQRWLARIDVKNADVGDLRKMAVTLRTDAAVVHRAADVESRAAEVLDVLLAL